MAGAAVGAGFERRTEEPRQLELARGLGGLAGAGEQRAQDEMRVGIGGVAAHGFAQREDAAGHVVRQRASVAEIEVVVGDARLTGDSPGEVRRRGFPGSGRLTPERDDAERVPHRGRRLLLAERHQHAFRAVVALELDERDRGVEPGETGLGRVGGHGAGRAERLLVQALIAVDAPQGRQHAAIVRRQRHRGLQKPLRRGRHRRHQTLDVVLEGRKRQLGPSRRRSRPGVGPMILAMRSPRRAPSAMSSASVAESVTPESARPSGIQMISARTSTAAPSRTWPKTISVAPTSSPTRIIVALRERRRQRQPQAIEERDAVVA